MKKKKPMTAGEIVQRFGTTKSNRSLDEPVAEARRGWKSEINLKGRKK